MSQSINEIENKETQRLRLFFTVAINAINCLN